MPLDKTPSPRGRVPAAPPPPGPRGRRTEPPTPPTVGRVRAPRGEQDEPGLPLDMGTMGPDEPALPDLMEIRIDEPEEPPHRGSGGREGRSAVMPIGLVLVAAGLLLLLLGVAGMVGIGAYLLTGTDGGSAAEGQPLAPLPPPVTDPVEPPVVAPAPSATTTPAPTAAPTPAKPEPVRPGPAPKETTPAPAPAPKPTPTPAEPAPAEPAPAEPAPAEPAPTEDPAAVTPDTPASLVVKGDAIAVELQGDFGGFRMGTPLPPGGYAVWADFGEGLQDTGVRTIALPGGTVTASCLMSQMACAVTP